MPTTTGGPVDDLALVAVDAGSEPAQAAMRAYFDELARRFPTGFDPGDALEEAAVLLNPPRGVFLLAVVDGRTVGCGGIQSLDEGTAEIKRMWVRPDSRGLGVGRRLLARLEDEARAGGSSRVVLDTNGTLEEAVAMYRAAGYGAIDRYNDNPYAQHWFAKSLTAGGEG